MKHLEQFVHLLQHLVRSLPSDCSNDCALEYLDDGGTIVTGSQLSDKSQSHRYQLVAMCAAGFVVQAQFLNQTVYYPTIGGIEFLEKIEHPVRVWIKENWFAAIVATVATVVSISNIVATVFLR